MLMTDTRTPTSRRRQVAGRDSKDTVLLQIYDFPPRLKKRLMAAADKAGSNVNDIAVACLARKFDVPFTPTGRKASVAAGDSTNVVFKMPTLLRRRIRSAAANNDALPRDVVIATLADEHRR